MSRADTLVLFGRRGGGLGHWLLLDSGVVAGRGESGAGPPPEAARTVLAVPGERTALHWLELDASLTEAQAAAAARLMTADLCAEPMAEMHVAVGPASEGGRCAALVRADEMADWLADARAAGIEPDAIVPDPLLLPEGGWVKLEAGPVVLYRGSETAFALEPEISRHLPGAAEAASLGAREFEEALPYALAVPAVDLRQGAFARKREWRLDLGLVRRLALIAIAIVLATLSIRIATTLRYTAAADRMEAEARELESAAAGGDLSARLAALRGGGLGFGPTASALFGAVQATAGVELAALVYQPSGELRATVQAESPAALGALRDRLAAQGLSVRAGPVRNAGGRHAADVELGPL